MQQKSSEKSNNFNKKEREWMQAFIEEEIRHGTPKKEAETIAEEVIHRVEVDTEN